MKGLPTIEEMKGLLADGKPSPKQAGMWTFIRQLRYRNEMTVGHRESPLSQCPSIGACRGIERTWAAPIQKLFDDVADGRWALDKVTDTADSALSDNEADRELCEELRDCRDQFLSAFAVIAADETMQEANRDAVFEAIYSGLLIGRASGRPEREWRLRQAQAARRGRAEKFAPRAAQTLEAVRRAMKQTATKATGGEKFARLIHPEVTKRLGRTISIWTVRDAVRALLKEAPRK
jgi:hypothetical protein